MPKIGYYTKYNDPKDGKEKIGLVISFDDQMVIIWNEDLKCPYAMPKSNLIFSKDKIKFEYYQTESYKKEK